MAVQALVYMLLRVPSRSCTKHVQCVMTILINAGVVDTGVGRADAYCCVAPAAGAAGRCDGAT